MEPIREGEKERERERESENVCWVRWGWMTVEDIRGKGAWIIGERNIRTLVCV